MNTFWMNVTWGDIWWGGWVYGALPLLAGWLLDRIFGDPAGLPHPIVWFGKIISIFERALNHGRHRRLKGGIMWMILVPGIFFMVWGLLYLSAPVPVLRFLLLTAGVFYCLAGTTLSREVKGVFRACRESLEAGRRYVARIVGRDTGSLSSNEVRTAALETLAENMSDGVVAPIFWFVIAGLPGMMAYKMINTLDSMVGYRNERYGEFGCVSARADDVANFIPARLTALLMVLAAGKPWLLKFVWRYGRSHASPNSGYPESALAGALDCRFGGTHDYFGIPVEKPYIGSNPRPLTYSDMQLSLRISLRTEILALTLSLLFLCL